MEEKALFYRVPQSPSIPREPVCGRDYFRGCPQPGAVATTSDMPTTGALSRYLTFKNPEQVILGLFSEGLDFNADPFLTPGRRFDFQFRGPAPVLRHLALRTSGLPPELHRTGGRSHCLSV